jgi:aminoglycoside phosphotransferase (APT) family kinase protein
VTAPDAVVDVVRRRADVAGPVEPVLVLDELERVLDAHGLGHGPVDAAPIGDGHSNFTFLIRRGDDAWVLRRPPRGPLPPSAHDVLREHRVLAAAGGTAVRVPRVVLAHEDPAAIGAPFYLMEHVPGRVLSDELPEDLGAPEDRRRIGEELVDALVEIHELDWRAAGLERFGRADGYLERQVKRFRGLWEHNATRDLPDVATVAARLEAAMPTSPAATLVHGDFRLGNVMFAPGVPPRLVAVLDWEMATIGDPLADLGWLVANWAIPGDADGVLLQLNAASAAPGFSTREELAARYAARSGRSTDRVQWYVAFALWKSAIFMEGSYRRWIEGRASDPFFAALEEGVPELLRGALTALDADAA